MITQKTKQSHKPASVKTILPKDFVLYVKKLEDFLNHNKETNNNYINIKWEKFSAISIYYRDLQIIGFSSIWHRPEYYEPYEARILNRYYEGKTMRNISKVIGDSHLINMVNDQINISKQLGFKKIFISREKCKRYFTQLINHIQQQTKLNWTLEPNKVCVCYPKAPSCWQYKAWANI